MGTNHGGQGWGTIAGRVPPEFVVGDANANSSSRFCHVSQFQAPDCLHYLAERTSTKYILCRVGRKILTKSSLHYNAEESLPTS